MALPLLPLLLLGGAALVLTRKKPSGSGSSAGNDSDISHKNCFRVLSGESETAYRKKWKDFMASAGSETVAIAAASAGSSISDARLFSLMCDVARDVPLLFAASMDKASLDELCNPLPPDAGAQYLCSPKNPNDIKCVVKISHKDQQIMVDMFTTTEAGLKSDIIKSLNNDPTWSGL